MTNNLKWLNGKTKKMLHELYNTKNNNFTVTLLLKKINFVNFDQYLYKSR